MILIQYGHLSNSQLNHSSLFEILESFQLLAKRVVTTLIISIMIELSVLVDFSKRFLIELEFILLYYLFRPSQELQRHFQISDYSKFNVYSRVPGGTCFFRGYVAGHFDP